MGLRIDTSEVHLFTSDLDAAVSAAPHEARKIVEKGLVNIKRDGRERAPHGPHTPHYRRSITYDMDRGAPSGEVGPDKRRRQGALGNIFEYGTVNSAPIPHMNPAADEELPRFERAMTDMAERLVLGR